MAWILLIGVRHKLAGDPVGRTHSRRHSRGGVEMKNQVKSAIGAMALGFGAAVAMIFPAAVSAVTVNIGMTAPSFHGEVAQPDDYTAGLFFGNCTGVTCPGQRSPWFGIESDPANPSVPYYYNALNGVKAKDTAPGVTGTATYNFGDSTLFEMMWGSPDPWNTLVFLDDGSVVYSLSGDDIVGKDAPRPRSGFRMVEVSDILFDAVRLETTQKSFEFAAISAGGTPVIIPEPGTLALIGLGLAGIGALRRRKLAA